MDKELSILSMVVHASLIVQLVMATLLMISIVSWTVIFRKLFAMRAAKALTQSFEDEFWRDRELAALYQQTRASKKDNGPLARIFLGGMTEFLRIRQQNPGDPQGLMEGPRRAMRAACQREMDDIDSNLSFLATAGSVSPYIGLFGTVWGIMNSFRGLANVHQATLSAVAPGIAEALVATAIGLFAAIPAVVAYNRLTADSDRLANRFETFIEEFSNILQRQAR